MIPETRNTNAVKHTDMDAPTPPPKIGLLSGFRNKAILIVVLATLVAALVALVGFSIVTRIKNIEDKWVEYTTSTSQTFFQLNEIRNHLGYGGFIHNFKNYVLRQDPQLVPAIKANQAAFYQAIDRYRQFPLNDSEHQALEQLASTLDLYSEKFRLAQQLITTGISAEALDKQVKVDDTAALAAINILATNALAGSRASRQNIAQILDDTVRYLTRGALLIPLIMLVGIILLYFLWQITRANRQTLAARQELDELVEAAPDAMLSVARDGTIVQANAQASRLFDYDKDTLLGMQVEQLIPERFRNTHVPLRNQYFMHPQPRIPGQTVRFLALRRDGREIPTEIRLSHVQRDDQVFVIANLRDVSERIEAERRIRQEKERTERFLDISEAVIVELDRNGCVTLFNQSGTRLLGYKAEDIIGKNWFELAIPADQRPIVEETFHKLMAGETEPVEYFENFVLTRSGEQLEIYWHNTLEHDERGRIKGTLSAGQDITERKKAERFKDEFLSTVSHEIRTPMTSILGSLALIQAGKTGELSEQMKAVIEIAHRNAERLLLLINDILDVQKLSSGKMVFDLKPLDLVTFLDKAVKDNHPYAEKHGVTLAYSANTDQARVRGDAGRLMQVMNNLISNAVKFSPRGDRVTVSLDDGEKGVRVAVADNGPGIPAKFHDRIFERFFQADSGDTRKVGGTGLGLNIAKAIIEDHHGTIDFDTTPGHGTTFYFELPYLSPEDNT
jgi:PAS domain S-box-containing protein